MGKELNNKKLSSTSFLVVQNYKYIFIHIEYWPHRGRVNATSHHRAFCRQTVWVATLPFVPLFGGLLRNVILGPLGLPQFGLHLHNVFLVVNQNETLSLGCCWYSSCKPVVIMVSNWFYSTFHLNLTAPWFGWILPRTTNASFIICRLELMKPPIRKSYYASDYWRASWYT